VHRPIHLLCFALVLAFVALPPDPALGEFKDLGTLPGGGYFLNEVLGVSGDGNVVVGSGTRVTNIGDYYPNPDKQAIRWEAGELTGLKPLVSSHDLSVARAASYDGSVVTGVAYRNITPQGGFVWTAGGYALLGDLPGGST
jgi:uncharacterized membrane protein